MNNKKHLRVIPFVRYVTISFLIISCSTYKTKNAAFQNELQKNNIVKAIEEIDNNSFLKKRRNLLLYYFEKGKASFLNNDYQQSNQLFNEADRIIEDDNRNIKGQLLGIITNPENETFEGEDFEKVAIHYYKALNYTFLNKPDDALVEAKRINLKLQQINDKYNANQKNRYSSDAFSLNLQGMLYEASGDINGAFISYRNAVDLYLENQGQFFGVSIPDQLKSDLLRTADEIGFSDQVLHYQELLKMPYTSNDKNEGGEVVVFWENGLVPYKDQTYYTFSILPGNNVGVVTVFNEELNITLPLPIDTGNNNRSNFSDIDIFNVAFPKYVSRNSLYTSAIAKSGDKTYNFQLTQDYENIAFRTLKDRTLREIGKSALRLATKKVSEYTLKKENQDLGAVLGIFNALTEHADTRNWQSLPQTISYTRIPLKKGENIIEFESKGINGSIAKQSITVDGNGGLKFAKISTLNVLN